MIKGGPRIVTDGLIYCLDVASVRGVSKAGCMGFNNADQLIKNLLSLSDTITTSTDLRLGNLNFYTLYAISYPEGNYTPANRDGITAGFNNISSGKDHDCSRDLNYFVWNNITQDWIDSGHFNGLRIAGHCYDTYSSTVRASEHALFQSDYANIVSNFPDAVHIVIGSHAAENNNSDSNTLAILQDLGGPSSWPGGRPEYILVGKPGLGADNAYVWQYENNNNQVAHANVGLPILGGKSSGGNYLDFNGSSDKADCGSVTPDTGDFTVEFVYQLTGNGGRGGLFERKAGSPYNGFSIGQGGSGNWAFTVSGTSNFSAGSYLNLTWTYPTLNTWYHDVGVYSGGNSIAIYRNGSLVNSTSGTSQGNLSTQGTRTNFLIANRDNQTSLPCKVGLVRVYNKALTASEVLRNYNATKGRFS